MNVFFLEKRIYFTSVILDTCGYFTIEQAHGSGISHQIGHTSRILHCQDLPCVFC